MSKQILKTREWERLLTYEQKEKYKNAIRQGYFSTYHGLSWRHDTFYGAFIWKHPERVQIIKRFENLIGHRPGWEDLTDDNIRDLFEDLASHYSPNSVKTLCAELSAVIRENDATRNIPSVNFSSILKAKKEPSQAVYLTMEEIKRIRDYNPRTKIGKRVKRLFMIECLTGARMSDCLRLSTDNISEDGRALVYVSQKSKIEVTVPIHRWLRPFLVDTEFNKRDIPLCSYNRVLREICIDCGIDERVKLFQKGQNVSGPKYDFVSSHTGRRSFATNLSKKGVSIEQIALMMGHMSGNVPNVSMTQHYIVGKMSIDSRVFDLFGAYEKDEPVSDYDEQLAMEKDTNF
jgi:integrase